MASGDDLQRKCPLSCCHRLFAGVRMKIDRRQDQSFMCAPRSAPIHRQLSKKETASSRPDSDMHFQGLVAEKQPLAAPQI